MIALDCALHDPEARDAARIFALAQWSSTVVPDVATMAVTPVPTALRNPRPRGRNLHCPKNGQDVTCDRPYSNPAASFENRSRPSARPPYPNHHGYRALVCNRDSRRSSRRTSSTRQPSPNSRHPQPIPSLYMSGPRAAGQVVNIPCSCNFRLVLIDACLSGH